MLSERHIQQFSRQILLREVGGIGQERLLTTPVRVEGQGDVFEVIRRTLQAGGSPLVDEPTLGELLIGPGGRVVVTETGVISGCATCVSQAVVAPSVVPKPELAVMVGSLAALAAQRVVLGVGKPFSIVAWLSGRLITETPKCPHSP